MIEMQDVDFGVHCPKHGAGPNEVGIVDYPGGDQDILCHCGNHLAMKRDGGKLYIRSEAEI